MFFKSFFMLAAATSFLVLGCNSTTSSTSLPEDQDTSGGYLGVTQDAPLFQYDNSLVSYPANTTIASNKVTLIGDGTITSFSISPDLHSQTGLTFTASTGTISGKPTTAHSATDYTVTAQGPGGEGFAVINIKVTATAANVAPSIDYNNSPVSYPMNSTISTNNVTVMGSGAITSYTISPDIHSQTGLTFSSSSGAISGKPTTAHAATNYTVTAHGPGGTGTAVVNVEITPDVPTLLEAVTWKMTAATLSSSIKYNGSYITNIYSILDACSQDNTIKFLSTGKATDKMGGTTCSSSSSTTDNWSLNSSQTTLTISNSNGSASYTIETLTSTTLKISTRDVDYGDGNTRTTTFTFKAQ